MVDRPVLLNDDDVRRVARPAEAVACMIEALAATVTARLTSPPRAVVEVGDGRLVVTAGAADETYGYRVYDTMGDGGEQVVVAHDRHTGRVLAIAVGSLLGALRTGALGGAAAALLGPRSAGITVALVGAGLQAWTQAWAISGVVNVGAVRVASRTPASREALAARITTELTLPAEPVASAEHAVRGADVVVLATTSSTPVINSRWLASDVLVVTLGHKQVNRAEFDLSLLDDAAIITTDSPAQLLAYDPPSLVAASGRAGEATDLGLVAAGMIEPIRVGRRVHLSVGLAGTEPLLLRQLVKPSK